MSYRNVLAVLAIAFAFTTSAQIIYEPVQSQHIYHGKIINYGGHDPRILDHAMSDIDRTTWSSTSGAQPLMHRQRVYSDAVPYENLADNSYTTYKSATTADAQNEANANVPLYFRKRDLLRAAVLTHDGSWVLPAYAEPRVELKLHTVLPAPTTHGTILIIPKNLLKPVPQKSTTIALIK